jgi:glutathione S-transferase
MMFVENRYPFFGTALQRHKAWAEALIARPSTHSFPEGEFEAMYRLNLKKRNKYLAQFVELPAVAAE